MGTDGQSTRKSEAELKKTGLVMSKLRVAVFNDTRCAYGHYGCSIVMSNLIFNLKCHNIDPVFYWPVGYDWRKKINLLPPIGSIDAIIVNGEGSIHDCTERSGPSYLAEVAQLAKNHYKVPSVLINATLHNNSRDLYRKLEDFDIIYLRDNGSLDELKSFGLQGFVVPDLSLSIRREKSYGERNGFGATDSVIKDVDDEIRKTCSQKHYEFVPMVRTNAYLPTLGEIRRPRKYAGKIRRYIKNFRRPRDVEFETSSDFIEWLESKEFVITGRYHTVTLCLLTRTPFVAFESNTPKISSLLVDVFGNKERLFSSYSDFGKADFKSISNFSDFELVKIEEFLSRAFDGNQKMFLEIYNTFNCTETVVA